MSMMAAMEELDALLRLPRGAQLAAVQAWRKQVPAPELPEAWNSAFGPDSLFSAWTKTALVQGIYAANAAALAPVVARPGFTVLEVGGGDGSLWRLLLKPSSRGQLVLVDPHPAAHAAVREALPEGVELVSVVGSVAEVALPAVDAAVCSLTLHHVAGADAAERRAHGLDGPGKLEALRAVGGALRGGPLLLNEADVFCDLGLAPGDPILADRILDSYLRRCGRALMLEIAGCPDPELASRWWAILRRWCVDQLDVVDAPIAERDVYELDVPRWLALVERAGLQVRARGFTDRWGLFCRYVVG